MSRCLFLTTSLGLFFGVMMAAEEDGSVRRHADRAEARENRYLEEDWPSLEVLMPAPDIKRTKAIPPKKLSDYSVAQRLEEMMPRLDRKFFSGLFRKNYSKAYEIALEEEHNILPLQLISEQMREQARPPIFGRSVEQWELLLELDERFRKLTPLEQQEILFVWREPFREKMQEYVSYRSSLKPWWTASLISNTSSDSNVNRTPAGVNAPANFSGRSGGQQTLVLSLNVKPMINNKRFPKDWKWDNVVTIVKQNQFAHQENDIATAGVEPKLSRSLDGPISKVALAYKYNQLFLKAGSYNSRQVKSFTQSHRLKFDLGSRAYPLGWGIVRQGKGGLSLSREWKAPFDPGTTSQEGVEHKLKLTHKLKLETKGGLKGNVGLSLELADFETEASPSSDYDYWKVGLQNDLKVKWGFWKHPIEFKEKFEVRGKSWGQRTGGAFDEELYTLALRVGTRVNPKLKSYIEAKQNWRETSQATSPLTETSAKQTQITFNLTWKIK